MRKILCVFIAAFWYGLLPGLAAAGGPGAACFPGFAEPVTLGEDNESFTREGMQRQPEIWEDGIREQTGPGHFEWWYFDGHLDDGSTVVLVYLTKPYETIDKPLTPSVYIDITAPDGAKYSTKKYYPQDQFSASDKKCDVKIGANTATGDLATYSCHADEDGLAADLVFTGTVPTWRPGVGKYYFGRDYAKYFGWLPAIPYGSVSGTLTYNGKTVAVAGSGYHDHNWGNVSLASVMNYWYWGRMHTGDYTAIFVQMTASQRYGFKKLPVFMFAKGGEILADNQNNLTLQAGDFVRHESSKNCYPREIVFAYRNGGDNISIALDDPELINEQDLLATLPPFLQILGRIFASPYYLRFNGTMTLAVTHDGQTETIASTILYEIMIFKRLSCR
jgi:predicted secreted hydrolase